MKRRRLILDIKKYDALVRKCSHCQFCQATCPVYLEDLFEPHVAGARAELIRACLIQGKFAPSRRFEEIVSRCLLCTNCVQTCPGSVPVDEVVICARQELRKGRPERISYKAKRRFMEDRGFGALLGKLGALTFKTGIFPKEFPAPAAKPFTSFAEKIYKAEGEKRGTTAYFVGCATNAFYPETALDVIRVLTRNGVEVLVPEGLKCCGMPALAEGDVQTAQELARNNLNILLGLEVDAIITDCTSCGMSLKMKSVKLIPENDPQFLKAHQLASKVFEATDYLNKLGMVRHPGSLAAKFTYHIPCHRKWTPTLNNAPRALLTKIPGAELIEMEYPERCCGAGGSFFLDFSDLSKSIRAKKVRDINRTETEMVITQCPACRSYLQAALARHKIMHPLSLLARAYGL